MKMGISPEQEGGAGKVEAPTFWIPSPKAHGSAAPLERSDLEDVLRPSSPSFQALLAAVSSVKDPSSPEEVAGCVAVARSSHASAELLAECGLDPAGAGKATVGDAFASSRGQAVQQGYLEMCLRSFSNAKPSADPEAKSPRERLFEALKYNGFPGEHLAGARSVAEWVETHGFRKGERGLILSSADLDFFRCTDLVRVRLGKDGAIDEMRFVQVKSAGFLREDVGKRDFETDRIHRAHANVLSAYPEGLRSILQREAAAKVEGEIDSSKKLATRLARALQPGDGSAHDALSADAWLCSRLAAAASNPRVREVLLQRYGGHPQMAELLDRAALVLPGLSARRLEEASQAVSRKDGTAKLVSAPVLALLRPDGSSKVVSELAVGSKTVKTVDLTAQAYAGRGDIA